LEYLHAGGLLHRNIKGSNILIDKKGVVKLSDFTGAGNLFEQGIKREQRTTFIGTIWWMAPEVVEQSGGYDTKADLWSFGITCIELVKGVVPFSDFQPMKVMIAILKHQSPTIDEKEISTTSLKLMIDSCLLKEPKNRPSAKDLLSYKFIKNFDKGSDYIVTNLLSNLPPLEKRGIVSEKPTEVTENSVEVEFDFENPEEMMKLDISEKMIIKIESYKENESDQLCGNFMF
jgi:serine/threonine protein kinase